jgi:hypothetical protein
MSDISGAVRQFERTFLPHTNPNEPPDDRKTWEDMMRYPKPAKQEGERKLIATIVYIYTRDAQGNLIDIQERIERQNRY